ncbi:Protein EFR3 [Candida viswanathii]|uniref:Protein EFR3 n=1 Tax=Candida viswanathii TaxID=5486 RepID=A0A367YBF6_9ASCO|nr:Protein EFR3 [Candida viswanathii]
MNLFQHKHQKLILQCYPAGKAADKKPNSSELSYLLYYASTRSVKLEKVINFLREKTQHDFNRNRTGNLQVTLAIIQELITKCNDNLNVFAYQVCDILYTIISSKDLALCKSVVKTFGILCDNLDGALFTGDKEFVRIFTEVFLALASLGKDRSGVSQYDWQMISLMAINNISKCLGYNQTCGKKFIALSVPTLIHTIVTNNPHSAIQQKLKSSLHEEDNGKRLSRAQLQKSQKAIAQQIDDDFLNDTLTLVDVNEEAFSSMKAFFNTNTASQISEVTRAVVQHNIVNGTDLEWGASFLELCITWIPVQLRFVSLSTLLATLGRISIEGNSKSNYNTQFQYARYLLGLLSSKVNMIGLSVSDIIQQLLTLQTDLILKPSDLDKSDVSILTNIYSDCICSLTTHIYYYDQVPDSIQEILVKVDFVLDSSFVDDNNPTVTGEQVQDVILQLLDNISKTFLILKTKPSSISRNHVNLEHWDISLGLLAPENEFDEHSKTILTTPQLINIQAKYLKVFDEFLRNELAVGKSRQSYDPAYKQSRLDPGSQGNDILHNKDTQENGQDFKKPDANQYITQQQNFISHFFMYIDKFFESYDSPNTELVLLLVAVLKHMISILGLNFVSNFIPFFHHWVMKVNKSNTFTQRQKFKDTIAHIILYYILKELDEQYSHDLQNYCKNSKLYKQILDAVEYRKLHKFWVHGIDSSPSDLESTRSNRVLPSDANGNPIPVRVKPENIEDFACGNNFLIVWLHPQKPLLTEIEKSQISTHMSTFNNDSRNTNNMFSMDQGSLFGSGPGASTTAVAAAALANSSSIQEESAGHFIPPAEFVQRSGLSSDAVSSNSEAGLYIGLGLGTAGDITMIHSEILQYSQHFQERGLPHANGLTTILRTVDSMDTTNDGSIYTYDSKYFQSPRVTDLKDAVSAQRGIRLAKPNFGGANGHGTNNDTASTANGSVLNRNMATTDVDSILSGLDSEDEAAFVV